MRFDEDTYTNLIMYILAKCCNKPHVGKTVICSTLYFIDFNYYEVYGKLLTKETYIKSKKGIKPKHFNEITNKLITNKQVFLKKEPYYNRTLHRYYLTTIPTTKFSENELKIINKSIDKLIDNNASTISKYATKDPPLCEAELGDKIDCRFVLLRPPEYSIKRLNIFNLKPKY